MASYALHDIVLRSKLNYFIYDNTCARLEGGICRSILCFFSTLISYDSLLIFCITFDDRASFFFNRFMSTSLLPVNYRSDPSSRAHSIVTQGLWLFCWDCPNKICASWLHERTYVPNLLRLLCHESNNNSSSKSSFLRHISWWCEIYVRCSHDSLSRAWRSHNNFRNSPELSVRPSTIICHDDYQYSAVLCHQGLSDFFLRHTTSVILSKITARCGTLWTFYSFGWHYLLLEPTKLFLVQNYWSCNKIQSKSCQILHLQTIALRLILSFLSARLMVTPTRASVTVQTAFGSVVVTIHDSLYYSLKTHKDTLTNISTTQAMV